MLRLALPCPLLVLSLLGLAAAPAFAGNTWTGGGASGNWSDAGNWGGSAPTYGTLSFAGSVRTTNANDSITAMNQVAWNGAGPWVLNQGGSTVLSLFDNGGTQAKLQNLGTGLVTVNAPMTFAANNAAPPNPFGEINAVGGDLLFTGPITVSGASVNGLKFFGSGRTTTFNGPLSAGSKWLALTATTGSTIVLGATVTCGDLYVMNGGTLVLETGGSLTSGALRLGGDFGVTGNQNLTRGGTFRLAAANGGQTFAGTINTVANNSSNALVVDSLATSGTNTLGGSLFLDSPLAIQNAAGGALALTGAVNDLKNQRLTVQAGGTITVANALTSSTGGGSLSKGGSGLLVLNGAGSYAGGTIVAAGTLRLGVNQALPSTSGSLALGGAGAVVDLAGRDQTVAGFNDNGGQTSGLLTNSATTPAHFTVNDTGLDNFAGSIADGPAGGAVRVTKAGPGVWTLSGANVYTGDTTIQGGTLALGAGGSLGSTAIFVQTGATFSPLQGTSAGANGGATGARLTVRSGGTVDLTSGGTGSLGTFTLNGGTSSFAGPALVLEGGNLRFDLGAASADQLLVAAGTASVSGANTITLRPAAGLSGLTPGSYDLISVPAGGLSGTFQFSSGAPLNVVTPSIVLNFGGNSYRLTLVTTPTALQLVIAPTGPRVAVNLMPLGASITEGASADNPYNGGGYRPKLYQYLANDGRLSVTMLGSNTRLFEFNPTAPNILTIAGQLRNEGHFGSTTSQILNNLNGFDNSNPSGSNNGGFWLAPNNGVNPNYITLNVGGNDYVGNPNDTQVVTRLGQIISTASTLRPGVTVIVSNLAWRTTVGGSINARYNPFVPGLVHNLVLNGLHVRFADMYSVLSPGDSNANLSSDQIHPSQTGYNLMADVWWRSFALGAAYWTGAQDNAWNTLLPDGSSNWASDHPRTLERQAALEAGTDVYFNANATPLTTTPGADVSIRSLNFAAGAAGPVSIVGPQTITLGAGGMTVQAGTGTHTIEASVNVGTPQTWSNISGNPLTVNGVLGGSQALRLVGPSFFNLGAPATFTGDVAIDSGGLFLAPGGNLSGTGFVFVGNGGPANAAVPASLLAAQTGAVIPNAIVTNKADTGSGLGSGTRTIGGVNTAGTVTFGGAIFLNGGSVFTSGAGGTTAFTNVIANGSDSGNVSRALTIAGAGTVRLDAANTYSGGTSINSGTLLVGSAGSLPGTGFVFVGNGGTAFAGTDATLLSANVLTPVGNALVTNKADTGAGLGSGRRVLGGANASGVVTFSGAIFLNGGAVLTATEPGGTTTFTNVIANGSDSGNVSRALTITGPGTVRLAANNTYSGSTTVAAGGTLRLDGSVPGPLTVQAGGTLTGSGTVQGNLTIEPGGMLRLEGGTFTLNGSVVNQGLVILASGARLLGSSPSFLNQGTFDLITAGTFTLPAGFVNTGLVLDASAVRVRSVSLAGGALSVSVDSHTGHVYRLQASPTLDAAGFVDVGPAQAGSTGTALVFTEPGAPGAKRFYRVVVSP
ncbi:MAG: autotransporter-associated beta strand repeat-containing protein [Verrucomicrobia bacterium]|nr:autotransporter-associated beta strand repeat-containing protein [Verrucomicrobiota bacterium]